MLPEDLRLEPAWDAVADAAIPLTIHVADPVAFFEPLDQRNERLEELLEHPDRWFGDRDRFPSFDRLLDSLEALVRSRSDVTFIGAHVIGNAEDIGWVGRMLDTYPNLHADVGARIAELGRVPRAAGTLMARHADRFLFGTDEITPTADAIAIHRRFFETADEHFAYSVDDPPPQGRWAVSGLDLAGDLLAAVYAGNARRLIPGLA